MYKKASIKYNGFTVQSPNEELSVKDINDPLTNTWAKRVLSNENYYIRLYDFDLTRITLQNPSQKRVNQHGSIFGANTDKERIIKIRGEICAGGQRGKQLGWSILNQIFSPEEFPSAIKRGLFKLEFEDYGNEKWFLYAQVDRSYTTLKQTPDDSLITPFTIYLKAEDVRIYGDELLIEEFIETDLGGLQLGESSNGGLSTEGLFARSGVGEIINSGTKFSSTKITITKADEITSYDSNYLAINPKISNFKTGKYFQVNLNMNLNDELVLDGLLGKIFLNGVENPNIKILGSNFIKLGAGLNQLVLSDNTNCSLYGKNIKASVEYRKIQK